GVVALSGYLPRPEVWQPPRTDLGGMPVLVTHGTYDSILPVAWGRAAAERLRQYNADVRYEEFPMDHEVNTACLEVIRGWLARSGVVALSGYLPRPEVWQPPRTDLGGMPVLVTHGTYDSILPVAWGRAAAERLRQYNADVRYEEFPMDHEVNTACLEVIRGWLA